MYRDMERTRKQFLEISPEDAEAINQLIKDIQPFSKIQMPITDIKGVKAQNPKKMSFGKMLKMFPAMPAMGKVSKGSVGEYASRLLPDVIF